MALIGPVKHGFAFGASFLAREGPRDPGHAKPGAEPDPRNRKTLGKNSPLNARGHLSHAASRKAGQLSRMKC